MTNSSRLDNLLALLEEQQDDPFLLFAIGKEFEKNDAFEEAIEYYETIRKVDPEYVGMYYHLAGLYGEMEEYDKALQIYDEGISIAEKLKDLHALSELKGAKMNLELEQ